MNLKNICLLLLLCYTQWLYAENGYELWLRYKLVSKGEFYTSYCLKNRKVMFPGETESLIAAKKELQAGLSGLLNIPYTEEETLEDNMLIVGTPQSVPLFKEQAFHAEINGLSDEGYLILNCTIKGKKTTAIVARTDIGVLYGVFHYLRLIQTNQSLDKLHIKENPKLKYRVLNHWDNLNGTVERGYAGYSIWNWERLPSYKEQRYTDYARANASIGINGTVLNNVNAQAKSLRTDWLVKASGLADVFRPYGIKVYLTAKFSAPKEIGGLNTADPKDPQVRKWWKDKVEEIYSLIPDFGGFLVKANSEGQPGPQDYGCSHADGANMLAEALKPYGGIVFWRAFVYQNERHVDRVINGYNEFKPLDGEFAENVFVQPKNGPIDFQPREPFHPLFGGMPYTPLSLEFQITQENLGHAGHLVYLGTLFEEVLQSDTYENGKGSTVSKVLQNYQKTHGISAIAGVPNIGTDLNWTGHLFGQANWYAFGRLAWKHSLSSEQIGEEWLRQTFLPVALQPYNDSVNEISPKERQQLHSQLSLLNSQLLQESREAVVDYMMPLGLHHIFAWGHHYGPEPWCDIPGARPDWMPSYYHRADDGGIGFDRSSKGSNATAQYHSPLCEQLDNVDTCPENLLLWFHHVPWNHRMKSGRTLWVELCYAYDRGVQETRNFQKLWAPMKKYIDPERFRDVQHRLKIQTRDAVWWKDACLLYFQQFSKQPIPYELERPVHELKDMMEYKLNITNFECPPYGFTK